MNKLKFNYYGLELPELTPISFLPTIIGTDFQEHSAPTFSRDGTEIYWSRHLASHPDYPNHPQTIMMVKYEKGEWSNPTIAPFSGTHHEGGPIYAFDKDKIFFYSMRPKTDRNLDFNNIWTVRRHHNIWLEPIQLPSPIKTSKFQITPSLAADGTLYYQTFDENAVRNMRFVYSSKQEGSWRPPQILSPNLNNEFQDWLPAISPDRRYFVFSSLRGEATGFDLYLTKYQNNTWSAPIKLQSPINTKASERFPGFTRDGKFLFFIRDWQIYWVSTAIL